METLTRVMARTVYGIDLNDPPLHQLTQRGNLKKFKKISSISQMDNRKSLTGWTRFHEPNILITENILAIVCEEDGRKENTLLALGTPPVSKSKSDTDIFVNKRHSLPIQLGDNLTNVKIVEETQVEVNKGCFGDKFTPGKFYLFLIQITQGLSH